MTPMTSNAAELDGQFLFHLLGVAFQFGFGDLKFVFEGEFKGFFGNQTFIKVGLLFGEDFGLGLGHAGPGQAFDEGVSVKDGDLSLHEAQNSA